MSKYRWIFSLLFGVFLLVNAYRSYEDLRKGEASEAWQATEATILKAELELIQSSKSGRYPTIAYKYTVAGQEYQSYVYRYGGYQVDSFSVGSFLIHHAPGKKIQIHFNPKNPHEATVVVGSQLRAIEVIAFFFFAIVMILVALFDFQLKRSAKSKRVAQQFHS